MKRKLWALLTIVFSLVACGRLTDSRAIDIIDSAPKATQWRQVLTGLRSVGTEAHEFAERLEAAGLMTIARGEHSNDYQLTERAKQMLSTVPHRSMDKDDPWASPYIALGDRTDVKIEKMSGRDDWKNVDYTFRVDPNEFGRIVGVPADRLEGRAEIFKQTQKIFQTEKNKKWHLMRPLEEQGNED